MDSGGGQKDVGVHAPDSWETADLDQQMEGLRLNAAAGKEEGLAGQGGSGVVAGVQKKGEDASVWDSPGSRSGSRAWQQDLEQVDTFLREALQNSRDRLTILRLEQEVEKFLRSPDLQMLEFQPMTSSYYRLAAHRVAQHYFLQTQVLDSPGGEGGRIIAKKTKDTHMPPVRLADIPYPSCDSTSAQEALGADKGPVKVAIKQRPSNHLHRGNGAFNSSGSLLNPPKTMEERKEEYNKARARIFSNDSLKGLAGDVEEDGQDDRNSPDYTLGLVDALDKETPATSSADDSGSAATDDSDKKGAPSWSSGFLADGGSVSANGGRGTGDSKESSKIKTNSIAGDDGTGKNRVARVAILRDREKERRDPDYDRNYDRYSQRFDQGFGAAPMTPYGIQPLYAPMMTYNTEFPSLGGIVGGPPRVRGPPPHNMYSDTPATILTSMPNPWGHTMHPLGAQFGTGDPTIGGSWRSPAMGMASHTGMPLLFQPPPPAQQQVTYQTMQLGGSGISYMTAEQYQTSLVQNDLHFTQQSASRRR